MSFSSIDAMHIEDFEEAEEAEKEKKSERASVVLGMMCLNAALTEEHRALLKSASTLVIFQPVEAEMVPMLETVVRSMENAPAIETAVALKKSGSGSSASYGPGGDGAVKTLEYGRRVVAISHDPARLLSPRLVAAADATVLIPRVTSEMVRSVIAKVSGEDCPALNPTDITGLGPVDIAAAIRPGQSAAMCVDRLRRSVSRLRPVREKAVAGGIENLVVTRNVREWSTATLDTMRKVKSGELEASALRFACLAGPPGTGKTTLAAALAASAGWNFSVTSVGDWFKSGDGHLGTVVREANAFFEGLLTSENGIVGLLDETENLPDRAALSADSREWWTTLIGFVLTQIDSVRKSGRPVLLLGASNFVDRLDMALRRAGRLELRVDVLLPDEKERAGMFRHYLSPALEDENFEILARLSTVATPAMIEAWSMSASATAARQGRDLTVQDLIALIAPQGDITDEVDLAVAIHEAGHAVVAIELCIPVIDVSIIRRGDTGGEVRTAEDNSMLTRLDVEKRATVLLAGRAADIAVGRGAHSGASGDIEVVNRLVREAMTSAGLYGPLRLRPESPFDGWLADGTPLGKAVEDVLAICMAEALEIVGRRRQDVLEVARTLVSERVIAGERLAGIVSLQRREDVAVEIDGLVAPTPRGRFSAAGSGRNAGHPPDRSEPRDRAPLPAFRPGERS